VEPDVAAGGDLQAGTHHQTQYETGGDRAEYDFGGSYRSTQSTMKVRMSEDFRVAYKRLKKRHKSLEDDFERLLGSLLQNPMQGVELENGVRKVRLAISSKGRGKSGGARVIIRVRIVADELQLLYIYDKSDFGNISDAYLRDIMKRMDS
jgi:hypothetical protein